MKVDKINIFIMISIISSQLFSLHCNVNISNDKILIITHAHSRPDFIDIHHKTFNTFLEEDFTYVVFNDAPSQEMRKKIHEKCKKLNIQCIDVQAHSLDRQTPNYRHCDGIKFSLELLGYDHNGIVMIIDSDMFLVRPLSIKNYMKDFDLIGGYQYRSNNIIKIEYTSPCLVLINMRKIPNKLDLIFESGTIEDLACDVGAYSYYYFKKNPHAKVYLYNAISTHLVPRDEKELRELNYDENTINLIFNLGKSYGMEFHGDNNFIHYYAGGSNWPGYGEEYLEQKNAILNKYIHDQLKIYKKR